MLENLIKILTTGMLALPRTLPRYARCYFDVKKALELDRNAYQSVAHYQLFCSNSVNFSYFQILSATFSMGRVATNLNLFKPSVSLLIFAFA